MNLSKETLGKITEDVTTVLQGIQVAAVAAPTLIEAAQPIANAYYTALMKAALAAYGEAQAEGFDSEEAMELTKAVLGIKLDLSAFAKPAKA